MSNPVADKLIVSNLDRLTQKYGVGGVAKVRSAVKKLIAADAGRGIVTVLVDLSDAATMAAYGVAPIPATAAGDAKLNKKAIDAVYAKGGVRPAYLMLMGSTDVIPHVPLSNPMAGDGDADVPSDLPYACDVQYSDDIQDFIAPTRVVGRLPSVTNDTDPKYLIDLLNTAATYSPRPASDYATFLGISAHVWKGSTELSLDAILGAHIGMKFSPADGYKWTAADAKKLLHFVNCHGAAGDPNFYGQKGASYPVAHSAAWMSSKNLDGTVLASECCYGAELYDPTVPTAMGQMGMCNTYLKKRAYAYFGSTNIAYGPAASNDQADLLCQYFCLGVVTGASSGRACLQARLDYVINKGGVLTPTDLKSLAQFNLMADPSLTPVASLPQFVIPTSGTKMLKASAAVSRDTRQNRRAGLAMQSSCVKSYRLHEPTSPPRGGKGSAFAKLRELAKEHGIKAPDVMSSYLVGASLESAGAKGLVSPPTAGTGPMAIHTILQRMERPTKLSHLALIRGLQAVEYPSGMDVQAFESR